MNRITIELNIAGHQFSMAYDVPDAPGEISPTDLNTRWVDEHLRTALRPVLGKLVPTAIVVKMPTPAPQPKRAAVGAL